MNGTGDRTGIDGRFRSAGRLLSLRALLLGLLVVAAGLQLTVVGSVLLARSWVAPAQLRHVLPWSTGLLLVIALGFMARERSNRRLRRGAIGLLVDEAPEVHADIHAYFADNLIGGIRDEAVRDICRERLAEHLAHCVRRSPSFRLRARPLWAWLSLFLLIWLVPWLLGFTPPRLVADFRRLLRLRTTPLTILSFAPEREWLLPGQSTVLRVTFNGTPMEDVVALLTDSSGQVTDIPLRSSGGVYSAPFAIPPDAFQLQVVCESRATPPRTYQVFPQTVLSLTSVEVVDGTGKVCAVHGPGDSQLTVRSGRRLRWHVQVAACPLRAYGVSSRSVSLTRTAADTWESVAESDAEFFTFWEPHGEMPIVQDRIQVKVVPDDPPEVSLSGPPQPEEGVVALPLTFHVSAQDDSTVRGAALAVADLRGWQQILPVELEPDARGVKGELTLTERGLRGRAGRYLMVWAVAEDDGLPANRGESASRFYLLPEGDHPEPPPPQPQDQPPPPENDMASALADNLDQMAQQAEENAANAQEQPGKAGQEEATGEEGQKQPGQENEPAQDEGKGNAADQADQPGQGGEAAQNEGRAKPGQDGQNEVPQGEGGQPGEAAQGQAGQPGQGEDRGAEPGQNGQGLGDEVAQGEGGQPGGAAQGQGDQPAQGEGGAQPGQDGQGQGDEVAQGEGGQPGGAAQAQGDQPAQGEGGAQPGQDGQGQGDEVAQGEGGQPGGAAQAQGDQPAQGEGGAQPGQDGQGPGNEVAQGGGGQGPGGQAGEGQGDGGAQGVGGGGQGMGLAGAQGNGAPDGQGQPGQAGGQEGAGGVGANGQPGGGDAGDAQGLAAGQGAGQPGGVVGEPAGNPAAGAGQGAEPPGQGVAGAGTQPGGAAPGRELPVVPLVDELPPGLQPGRPGEGETVAAALQREGDKNTGEPEAEVLVAVPGEGDGKGEKQQVLVRGPGGGGIAPPDAPLKEGERQAERDAVDESLRLAARQEGVAASERKGTVSPAENSGETVATGEAGEHGGWGAGRSPDAAPSAVHDDAAPAAALPSAEPVTPGELGGEAPKPDAQSDATLIGAGGSGSRTALADSPAEQAIRAHEEAMRKLTGTEKAATREYYRRLKDIR